VKLPRWLDPRTNAPGWSAALGVAYAIWQGITAAQASGPLTWKLVGHVAAGVLWAAVSAYVRSHVTPVADPRDGNGKPYVRIPAGASVVANPGLVLTADEIKAIKDMFSNVTVQPAFAPMQPARPPAVPQTEGKTTP